jgi:hypothetical protein
MAQINKPSDYFDTITFTGTGANNQQSHNLSGQADLVWSKMRSAANSHFIFDRVRDTYGKALASDTTGAESTRDNTHVNAIDSSSITWGSAANVNESGSTFVNWLWQGGGTASSNTDGSITSQVSASTTSGFSIVSYTGTGANATVGHGLGVAPKMVIFKNRDNGTQEWDTYHTGLTDATYFIQLNSSNAQNNTNGALRFNSTAPTSSVFSVGTATTTNESGNAMIAYCFAEKKGYSKIGSYTGNGSTDGTFVYTGFKPAFVIRKRTDSTADWRMDDSKRDGYNVIPHTLFPNLNNEETTNSGYNVDLLSNGFKCRGTSVNQNASGATYIYMAFAAEPLTGTNGIPCTAR